MVTRITRGKALVFIRGIRVIIFIRVIRMLGFIRVY